MPLPVLSLNVLLSLLVDGVDGDRPGDGDGVFPVTLYAIPLASLPAACARVAVPAMIRNVTERTDVTAIVMLLRMLILLMKIKYQI
jgi:hypothetical protein